MKITALIPSLLASILKAYRHIAAWILAKICITILSLLIAFICIIPFIVLVIIIGIIDPIDWLYVYQSILPEIHDAGSGSSGASLELISMISENIFWVICITLVLALGAIAYFLMSFLGLLLHTQYLCELLHNDRKGILNIFIGLKKSTQCYIQILLGFLFRLSPIFVLLLVIYIIVGLSLGGDGINMPSMIIGSILGFASLAAVLFIVYRNMLVFVECGYRRAQGTQIDIKDVFRSSRTMTRGWKFFFRFFAMLVCILLVLVPIRTLGKVLQHQEIKVRSYILYTNAPEEYPNLSSEFIESYALYTDAELTAISRKWVIINYIFSIFYILFIDGLLLIGLITLHHNILHKQKIFPGKA